MNRDNGLGAVAAIHGSELSNMSEAAAVIYIGSHSAFSPTLAKIVQSFLRDVHCCLIL